MSVECTPDKEAVIGCRALLSLCFRVRVMRCIVDEKKIP